MEHTQLQQIARTVRQDIIRQVYCAGSGHPGGSLSAADLLTALYFSEMHIDPAQPAMEDRDRFVLSKGHAAPALYACLAERGFFPKEDLVTLRKIGSRLQGHPSMKMLPGVEMSTGSLGQGISAAVGMAAGASTRCSETANCRKASSGKLPWRQGITSWITCAPSWTTTVCRSTDVTKTS